MNGIRTNFLYIVLTVIAIGLIAFTLVLQYSITNLETDAPTANNGQAATATATALPVVQIVQTPEVQALAVDTTPSVDNAVAALDTTTAPIVEEQVANDAGLEPEELLELELLGAANLTTSEEDGILVQLIQNNPLAIGFIRYSSYLRNQDTLRALKIVDNSSGLPIAPNEDTVASGAYPFSRPLLIYTSAAAVQTKSALEGYMGCYLNRIFDEVEDVGYTPPSLAMYRDALENFEASCTRCQMAGSTNPLFSTVPACSVENLASQPLNFTGGTTVYALSDRMITRYREAGYSGDINIEDIGTSNGFERFCQTGDADLVNASRLVKDSERELCAANGRPLVAFPVGLDLVVVVVSQQNPFIEQATFRQLEQLFTGALRWSDVDGSWSSEFIVRAIPNKSRGTFSFFVETLYAGASVEPAVVAQPTQPAIVTLARTPATATPGSVASGEVATTAPAAIDTPSPVVADTPPPATDTPAPFVDYHIGYLEGDAVCTLAAEVMQRVLQEALDYNIALVSFATKTALYDQFSAANSAERIDWTPCYTAPADLAILERNSNTFSTIGASYFTTDGAEYQSAIYNALRWVLRQEEPCIYGLLTEFQLEADSVDSLSATEWIDTHQDLVATWSSCR